ncbi:MAG: DNA polymerase III subunit epsilon [Pseudomonadota bacterium]
MRQVVLDTETTGLEVSEGHRIIEIGCVELANRRPTGNIFHHYVQPEREIDPGAIEIHGIKNEDLKNKPRFTDIANELIEFLSDSELIIHNAPFDLGFINAEFSRIESCETKVEDICTILDSLELARKLHPGQKNNLNALCSRYSVDNSNRDFHGALLDAEILSEVYLQMTGGQESLSLSSSNETLHDSNYRHENNDEKQQKLRVIQANDKEKADHKARLQAIEKDSNGKCLWLHIK